MLNPAFRRYSDVCAIVAFLTVLSACSDDDEPSARTFYEPYDGIASDGAQLAIADASNHRVLVWRTFPTTSFQPADLVLGQSTLTLGADNDDDQDGVAGDPSSRTLSYPTGVAFHRDRLLVTDTGNNRVLVFRSR